LGNLSGFAAFASIEELLNVDSKRPGKSIIKPIAERTQGSLSLYMLLVAETFDDWVTNNCWTHLVRVSSHGTPPPSRTANFVLAEAARSFNLSSGYQTFEHHHQS